jgi:hypothetical protein
VAILCCFWDFVAMQRRPVESEAIRSVGYDPKAWTLEVEFVDGDVYRYHPVPRGFYAGLLRAASMGRYLNTRIKPFYEAEKVEPAEEFLE